MYQFTYWINQPSKFIYWTLDELVIFVIPFFVCAFVVKSIWILPLPFIIFKLWKRFKKGRSVSALRLMSYWFVPAKIFKMKACPPNYHQVFVA
jgi:type IV conjugative transfer system protein TraL